MPRLAPKLLELEQLEQEEIEKILARHSTSQQVARRAKIIILASKGKNHRAIARELNISRKMAQEMVEQKIVASISPRHVARLLSEASLKPHCSEYWLNPPPTKDLTRKSKIFVNCTSKQSR